jgi:MFS family permease
MKSGVETSATLVPDGSPPLLTARFLTMCGFGFAVFLSAFQLFPTVPFRILDLGGSTFTAGLFLGCLTYASASSAPFTGTMADRVGRRRTLIWCSLVIALLSFAYALAARPAVLLVLAVLHGVFWSGLLSANAAYTTELVPAERRAEGIGYHGLASVLAIAVAPSLGLWIYRSGWMALCASIGTLSLIMAAIVWHLPDDRAGRTVRRAAPRAGPPVEWHVTVAGLALFLAAFGYGGVTSFAAIYAEAAGIRPRGLYFTILALSIVVSRPFAGRAADRLGTERVLVPCLLLAAAGYGLLAWGKGLAAFAASAAATGVGFGSAYPVFAAFVLRYVEAARRGAAFGGILAALDTGIGSGSTLTGWLAGRYGFRTAFAVAALLALGAAPYFLLVGRRVLARRS